MVAFKGYCSASDAFRLTVAFENYAAQSGADECQNLPTARCAAGNH